MSEVYEVNGNSTLGALGGDSHGKNKAATVHGVAGVGRGSCLDMLVLCQAYLNALQILEHYITSQYLWRFDLDVTGKWQVEVFMCVSYHLADSNF